MGVIFLSSLWFDLMIFGGLFLYLDKGLLPAGNLSILDHSVTTLIKFTFTYSTGLLIFYIRYLCYSNINEMGRG